MAKFGGKVWMGMAMVAFAYLLFASNATLRPFRTPSGKLRFAAIHGTLNERRAMFKGLIGGLLCALPALAITLVGLIVSVPPESWVDANDSLPKGAIIPPASNVKRVYLIGIDLSLSSITSSRDPRLHQLCKAVSGMLERPKGSSFSEIIKSEDIESFYIFAENQKPLFVFGSNNILEKPSNSQISEKVCEDLRGLADHMVGSSDDIGRGKTDVVKFLEDMVGKMKALPNDYRVTLIVFSDFRQDDSYQLSRDLDERVGILISDISTLGNQLVGFTMPTVKVNSDKADKDIGKLLRRHCCGGERRAWKEVRLSIVDEPDAEPLNELRRNIYREERLADGLRLKFQLWPFSGTSTYVDLPPEYGRVLLALRQPEGVNDNMADVGVVIGDTVLRSTVLKMGDVIEYEVSSGNHPGRLPLRLSSPVDVSRDVRFDLQVVDPDSSVIHTVGIKAEATADNLPLEMLRWALALAAITFILLVIGASGADLWLTRKFSWLSRRLRFRKRGQRPVTLAR